MGDGSPDQTFGGGEAALVAAIAALVAEHPARTVPLAKVLVAAASVDRTAASQVGWRFRVAAAVDQLVSAGVVEVPSTSFDRTAEPPLPNWVRRPKVPSEDPADSTVVWHRELAWAARADDVGEVTRAERRVLAQINRWLPSRRGLVVPLRERSLEIFGDEKELEMWAGGRLFTDGPLSFDLLECEPCWPPVHQDVAGDGPWLLVENYTTYVSVCRWARRHGFDGRIVWGSGNQVGTRLAALAAPSAAPPALWYFGDVDVGGFRIARSAVNRAAALGLGDLVPARGMYQLALDHGVPRRVTGPRTSANAGEWARMWLGGQLGAQVGELLAGGCRVVQESVGTELLAGQSLNVLGS